MTQSQHLQRCLSLFDQQIEGIKENLLDLDREVLLAKPAVGDWTIAQIAEHLRISGQSYEVPLSLYFKTAPRREGDPDFKETWLGAQILKRAGPGGKAPVPKMYEPSKVSDPDAIRKLLEELQRLRDIAAEGRNKDLGKIAISSPMLSLLRFSAGDVLIINAMHGQRHLGQIYSLLNAGS